MTDAITLDPDAALARGKDRLVFQHPTHPDRVVKVMRPRYAAMLARKRVVPFSKSWRLGVFKHFAREVAYWLECQARHPELSRLTPAIHGFEPTNLGLGLVCEKIGDGRGGLAPTLADLEAGPGLGPRVRRMLEELFDTLGPGHFVFRDMNKKNIVVAPDRLVIVDGFGDFGVLPLRQFSARLNRFHIRRDIRRLRGMLGLTEPGPAAVREAPRAVRAQPDLAE